VKERIKKLRKALGLTQQEFADRIGISRGNIATYETRDGSPGASVIALICRTFNVSENWLRTGEGGMFVQLTTSEEISVFFADILSNKPDSFKQRFVLMLSHLSEREWGLLEKMARELLDNRNTCDALTEGDIEREVAAYRAQLELEARRAEKSSASGATG